VIKLNVLFVEIDSSGSMHAFCFSLVIDASDARNRGFASNAFFGRMHGPSYGAELPFKLQAVFYRLMLRVLAAARETIVFHVEADEVVEYLCCLQVVLHKGEISGVNDLFAFFKQCLPHLHQLASLQQDLSVIYLAIGFVVFKVVLLQQLHTFSTSSSFCFGIHSFHVGCLFVDSSLQLIGIILEHECLFN